MVDPPKKHPSASHLLLVADRAPLLPEPQPDASAAAALADQRRGPDFLWDERAHADDLTRQRWGVIAPEGVVGDQLLEAIAPLIAHRRRQTGADRDVIHRVPPALDQAAALRWYKRVFEPGDAFRDAIPRYVLILGDLAQVSLELQQIVGATAFVGRLAFETAEQYAAYVAKVLGAEATPPFTPPPLRLHAVDDGTGATSAGRRGLIDPGVRLLRGAALQVAEFADPEDLGPDRLRAALSADRGGIFFSVSHGLGAPRRGWSSADEQRRRQGAMSLGERGDLDAERLQGGALLPGGLWFMLACFGAGTPTTSAYARWLEQLASSDPRRADPRIALHSLPPAGSPPFIAALPKAALASPRGPLAFIGHVDLAWTYAFRETHEGPVRAHPARFMALLRAAHQGARIGAAFRELYRYFEQTNTELSTLDPDRADPERRGALWMLRQDLGGYVLLGDPAVRLLGRGESAQPAAASPGHAAHSVHSGAPASTQIHDPAAAPNDPPPAAPADASADFFAGFGLTPTRAAAAPIPLPILEQALAHDLLGHDLQPLLDRHRLDPTELQRALDRYRRAGRRAHEESP